MMDMLKSQHNRLPGQSVRRLAECSSHWTERHRSSRGARPSRVEIVAQGFNRSNCPTFVFSLFKFMGSSSVVTLRSDRQPF